MGVNLTELVKSAKPVSFKDLEGKRVAIDAYNTMYQFISIIRDRFTGEPLRDSSGNVTSHLSGIFYRTSKMLESKIEPIYVFDGKPPEFKHRTIEERNKIRENARKKWEEAVEKKDYAAVRRYSMQASKLTPEMIKEAKRLLDAMGVPWIQAPSEGEAQAANMVRKEIAWSTASQDWDSLLFNTPRFVKNLTITGRRKVPRKEKYVDIVPEIIEHQAVLDELGIGQDQLILLGMLVGTDYNPGGIKGIGPKKALAMVKESKTLEEVVSRIEWDFEPSPEEIFSFFKSPPVEDVSKGDVKQGTIDVDKVKEVMCESHDFSEDRIMSTINKLQKAGAASGQSKLESFFGK
ncbi:MAG: flap endonuclease-1 [Candidatus Aenigmatarchaeota archaeon]|nr:MAG: flap endonuclease-1 [Candidatus Aenigmarchaeota archaeon]